VIGNKVESSSRQCKSSRQDRPTRTDLGDNCVEAPALPTDAPKKEPKVEMEDFLDELLG
jgi:hypothetical protein